MENLFSAAEEGTRRINNINIKKNISLLGNHFIAVESIRQ